MAEEMETLPLLSPGSVGGAGPKRKGLSMFFGVFVPCVLSIFSVILFLRLGFVIGQSGFSGALAMLLGSYFVVGLTILSISAISTNGVIHGGGAYYMISRSLGPEFGGSIGIIFYLANVCASALYVAGFVEALVDNFGPDSASGALPDGRWAIFGYSAAVLAFCLVICLIGANAFAKASFLIFLIVMASVISVFVSFATVDAHSVSPPSSNTVLPSNATLEYTGFSSATFKENMPMKFTSDYTTGQTQNFQSVFAVLFNGCTGIMAGANMSGDLANPSRSIPWGTLAASAFTLAIYILIVGLTSATTSRELLVNDYSYISDISISRICITIGVFAATLSAALSTLIGSSRILQAISRDNLIGTWFKFFSKETGEPIRAVLMSWLMVQCVLFVGAINVIAPIVSMLFLLCYGMVNVACFMLRVQSSPNFRPTFRFFSWHTALLGALCCFGIMFFISPIYAAASFCFMLLLFLFINSREVPAEWGDVSQALIYHQVRKYLLRLKPDTPVGAKYWRPQLLVLVSNPRESFQMAHTMNDMKKGGLLVLGTVHVGKWSQDNLSALAEERTAWQRLAALEKWKAFVDGIVASTLRGGVQALLMTTGLGGMRPNTIVVGFFQEDVPEDQIMENVAQKAHAAANRSWKRTVRMEDYNDLDAIGTCFPHVGSEAKSMSGPQEYVGMLQDACTLQKNIVMTRAFHQLPAKLEHARKSTSRSYMDVWIRLTTTIPADESRTIGLLLQLPTVLHMVRRWRAVRLRVLVLVDKVEDKQSARERVMSVLEDVRIVGALVEAVTLDESPGNDSASPAPVVGMAASIQGDPSAYKPVAPLNPLVVGDAVLAGAVATGGTAAALPAAAAPTDALQAARNTNRRIRALQQNTCLTFVSLPEPPVDLAASSEYIATLHALTENTGPTCLIHGLESVLTHNATSV